MRSSESAHPMRPTAAPLALVAAVFVTAGGFIHLREWIDTYRDVPADVAGAAVVRLGFPANAAVSLLVAATLVVTLRWSRFALPILVGAFVFQAASLATLIATRTGSVLGWSEPTWTPGAEQSRAVEVGALLALAACAALHRFQPGLAAGRGTQPTPVLARSRP